MDVTAVEEPSSRFRFGAAAPVLGLCIVGVLVFAFKADPSCAPSSYWSDVPEADAARMRSYLEQVEAKSRADGVSPLYLLSYVEQRMVAFGGDERATSGVFFDVTSPDGSKETLVNIGYGRVRVSPTRYVVWDMTMSLPKEERIRIAVVDSGPERQEVPGLIEIRKDLPAGAHAVDFPAAFAEIPRFPIYVSGYSISREDWANPSIGPQSIHFIDPARRKIEVYPLTFWNRGWRNDAYNTLDRLFYDASTGAIVGCGDRYPKVVIPWPFDKAYRL